jgi:hypothetical protein
LGRWKQDFLQDFLSSSLSQTLHGFGLTGWHFLASEQLFFSPQSKQMTTSLLTSTVTHWSIHLLSPFAQRHLVRGGTSEQLLRLGAVTHRVGELGMAPLSGICSFSLPFSWLCGSILWLLKLSFSDHAIKDFARNA